MIKGENKMDITEQLFRHLKLLQDRPGLLFGSAYSWDTLRLYILGLIKGITLLTDKGDASPECTPTEITRIVSSVLFGLKDDVDSEIVEKENAPGEFFERLWYKVRGEYPKLAESCEWIDKESDDNREGSVKEKKDILNLAGIVNSPKVTLEEVRWDKFRDKSFRTGLYRILHETGLSLEYAQAIIKGEIRKEREEEIEREIRDKERFIGKCFVGKADVQEMQDHEARKYYKVVSARCKESDLGCLCFEEHPVYQFERTCFDTFHAQPDDVLLGHYFFDSFCIDGVRLDALETMEEITPDVFNQAAKRYISELLETEWSEADEQ